MENFYLQFICNLKSLYYLNSIFTMIDESVKSSNHIFIKLFDDHNFSYILVQS